MKTDLTWAQDVSHGRKDMTSTTTPSSGTLNTEFKDRAYCLQNDRHVRALDRDATVNQVSSGSPPCEVRS